jgi:hypothetical protein
MPGDDTPGPERSAYVGWYVAGIVLFVIFAAAAAMWLIYHPL